MTESIPDQGEKIIRLTPEKRDQLFRITVLREQLDDLRLRLRGVSRLPERFREACEAKLTAEYKAKAREHDRLVEEFTGK